MPLDEALAEGLRDSVDILMTSMGAGPVRWDAHESVLHAAARVGSPALCSIIVARQPQLRRAQARGGVTPLHTAAQHDRLANVEELLRLGNEGDADVPDEVRPTRCLFYESFQRAVSSDTKRIRQILMNNMDGRDCPQLPVARVRTIAAAGPRVSSCSNVMHSPRAHTSGGKHGAPPRNRG